MTFAQIHKEQQLAPTFNDKWIFTKPKYNQKYLQFIVALKYNETKSISNKLSVQNTKYLQTNAKNQFTNTRMKATQARNSIAALPGFSSKTNQHQDDKMFLKHKINGESDDHTGRKFSRSLQETNSWQEEAKCPQICFRQSLPTSSF